MITEPLHCRTSVCTLPLNKHKKINQNQFFEPLTFEQFIILIKSNTRKKPCYLAHYENFNFKMYQHRTETMQFSELFENLYFYLYDTSYIY